MFPFRLLVAGISLFAAIQHVSGQTLPNTFSATVKGTFSNAVAEGSNSMLVADNNLTNGYNSGSDLKDAPSSLATNGPAGSAFFQWGRASTGDSYPHASALWFLPDTSASVTVGQDFHIGSLYYRNGTIQSSTGASAVDFNLTFTLSNGTTIVTSYTSNLVNTPNTGTAEQNADIVSLANPSAPISYKDSAGNTYYLDLSFKITADSLNSSLSNSTEFRAYEGTVNRADLFGRFTTTPATTVPEPSALLVALLGLVPFLSRRKR